MRLDTGELIAAPQVIGAIDPKTLIEQLTPQEHVPENTKRELRALNVRKWNISHFKADSVLSERPKLACGRQELLQGYVLLAPTLDHIRRAQAAAIGGRLPLEPPQWMACPSIPDPTQKPEHAQGETFLCYAPIVPLRLQSGKRWDDIQNDFHEEMLKDLELYAPGLTSTIQGQRAPKSRQLPRPHPRGSRDARRRQHQPDGAAAADAIAVGLQDADHEPLALGERRASDRAAERLEWADDRARGSSTGATRV